MTLLSLLIPIAAAQDYYGNTQGADVAESGLIDFATLAGKIMLVFVIIAAVTIVAVIVKKMVQRAIEKKQGDSHKELVILYGRVAFTSIIVAGTLMALMITGMPLEWFTGALGLGLAFAVRDPVANFMAGIVLLTQDNYNIGDFIKIGETGGTIVDISSRATVLRAIDGAAITVPNLDLLTKEVTCYTRNPIRRREISIGVGYGTHLKAACDLIAAVVKKHHGVEPVPAPSVIVSEIADSTVNLKVRFWVETRSNWIKTQSEITREVFDTLMAAGVDIPYPTRTMQPAPTSDAVLAGNQHLIDRLAELEKEKTEAELRAVPSETTQPVAPAAAQPQPVASQPAPVAQPAMPQPTPVATQTVAPTQQVASPMQQAAPTTPAITQPTNQAPVLQ